MTRPKKRFFQEKKSDSPNKEFATISDSDSSNPNISNKPNEGDHPFNPNHTKPMELESSSIMTIDSHDPSNEFESFTNGLKSVLGDISSSEISQLFHMFSNHEDKLLLAIDHYFKQDEKENLNHLKSSTGPSLRSLIPPIRIDNVSKKRKTRGVQIPFAYAKKSISPLKQEHDSDGLPVNTPNEPIAPTRNRRYAGSIYADAYATRPYLRPLNYGKLITIKSLKPTKKPTGRDKHMHNEFGIIRLYASPNDEIEDEREFGRLKEDLTRILAPLMDLGLAEFNGSIVVETSKRLSIGDSVYIKIDCFLTQEAFEQKNLDTLNDLDLLKKNFLTKARFNFGAETEGETNLKLRQYAIYRLFEKLQIRSVRIVDNKEIPGTQALNGSGNSSSSEIIDIDSDTEPFVHDEDNQQEDDAGNAGVLTLNQLQSFYLDNQQSEMLKALPDNTQPPKENFKMTLRPYQRHGLSWMLAREKELDILKVLTMGNQDSEEALSLQQIIDMKSKEEGAMNPLWKIFKWPEAGEIGETGEYQENQSAMSGKYFYGNMYSGELSLTPPLIKSSLRGGILADEMGLGKTISALSLVNSVPYDLNPDIHDNRYAYQTTLVIVPMSLLSQWQKEFENANNNPNHKCIIYYGQQSIVDLSTTLVNKKKHIPIMMITTYGTVLNEYTKIEKRRDELGNLPRTGLFSVKFFRILIDEGHQIRNRITKTSRAVFELELNRKWVLTGTPIINRLDDLYSVVKYLDLEPWNNISYWKTFVTLPFEQKQIQQTLEVVKSILEPILLRRTKDMKDDDGQPLVTLPSKEVVVEQVKFNKRETKLYEWFKEKANKSFRQSLESGEVLRKYSQILTHILRLRQICCHMDLVSSAVPDLDEDIEKLESLTDEEINQLKQLADSDGDRFANETEAKEVMFSLYPKIDIDNSECTICTTNPIGIGEMVITTCGHSFCLNCLLEHIEFQNSKNDHGETCPNCRSLISKYKLFKVRDKETNKKEYKFHTNQEVELDFKFQLYVYDPAKVSSKTQALINHIVTLKDQKITEPIVVFSQFSSYLDLIQNELKLQIGDKYIRCLKFDGRLSENQRKLLLQDFNKSSNDPSRITILLISLKAGGVGLNLTNASRAFMMDPWWSPSIEDQAIDRLHRIGQNNNVKVIRFIMENSIETKMLKIQEMKKQIGEVVGVEEEEKRRRRIEEIQILFEE